MNFTQVMQRFGFSLKKHAPAILTGVGIAGMISSAILAVKATPKAIKLMEEKKNEEEKETLTVKEIVKTTWICYIPSVIVCVVSAGCLIGASQVQYKRSAALITACSLSETALKEYQSKVSEVIGEKKETAIRDSIAKDRMEKDPVTKKEIIFTNKGDALCYDALSGRYFKSDIDKLRKTEIELNQRMLSEMFISLNDFYYEIGLSSIKLGDFLGWNIDKGMIHLEFSSQLAEDGTPCLVLGYSNPPQYEYA